MVEKTHPTMHDAAYTIKLFSSLQTQRSFVKAVKGGEVANQEEVLHNVHIYKQE